jgi:hypothetical protein
MGLKPVPSSRGPRAQLRQGTEYCHIIVVTDKLLQQGFELKKINQISIYINTTCEKVVLA